MFPPRLRRVLKFLLPTIAALIMLAALGLRLFENPSCEGQLPCAVERATALSVSARNARHTDLNAMALPLIRALERGDCVAAGEYARALRAKSGELGRARESVADGVAEACGAAADESPGRDAVGASIIFSRGACEGKCPTYTMTLRGDGALSFEGHMRGEAQIKREANLGAARARSLFAMLDRIRFERMAARYTSKLTDAPPAIITLLRGGETRIVADEATCLSKEAIEAGLCFAETRLTDVLEEQGWLNELRGTKAAGK